MKRRWMTKQMFGYTVIATVLALCSLPTLPNQSHVIRPHHSTWADRHRAVPTMALAKAQALPVALAAIGPGPGSPTPGSPGAPSAPPAPSQPSPAPGPMAPDGGITSPSPLNPQPLYRIGKLRVHVIDGRTLRPLSGAEVVLIENEQRLTTDADGYTGWFQAPIIRNPRYRPMIAELHGQLGVVVYKNGYRDCVHLGIRIHDEAPAEVTVWMYKIGPGDRRIEPVLYEEPYHHLWLIELTDRFRSKTQPGEGPQHP